MGNYQEVGKLKIGCWNWDDLSLLLVCMPSFLYYTCSSTGELYVLYSCQQQHSLDHKHSRNTC